MDVVFSQRHGELLRRIGTSITSMQDKLIKETGLGVKLKTRAAIVSDGESIRKDLQRFKSTILGEKATAETLPAGNIVANGDGGQISPDSKVIDATSAPAPENPFDSETASNGIPQPPPNNGDVSSSQ
jgi:hypothetical protein